MKHNLRLSFKERSLLLCIKYGDPMIYKRLSYASEDLLSSENLQNMSVERINLLPICQSAVHHVSSEKFPLVISGY